MHCRLPRLCVVVLLPPPAQAPSAPVCHGYAYLAIELQALPPLAEVGAHVL